MDRVERLRQEATHADNMGDRYLNVTVGTLIEVFRQLDAPARKLTDEQLVAELQRRLAAKPR